jgi:nucleoside-diphosphate-sugar epimerase
LNRGSKKLAEEAAWQFVETSPGVNFSLATINPTMVYGPAFPESAGLKHLGQSMSEIYALMDASLIEVPPTMLPAFVDVRDVARAHLLAFETDQPQRFLISGGDFDKQKVCDLLRDQIPELKSRVPVGNPGNPSVDEQHYKVDCSRARSVLGIEFRPFNETFLDMAHAFLDMENAEKGFSL